MATTNPIILNNNYETLGTHFTGSNIAFTGSVLPAGELFRTYFTTEPATTANTDVSSSFITDVKVTLKNPLNLEDRIRYVEEEGKGWNMQRDMVLIEALRRLNVVIFVC